MPEFENWRLWRTNVIKPEFLYFKKKEQVDEQDHSI